MSRSNTNTQCIRINTPKATPLNTNALLWRLFEMAKIEMPTAEAYEYAEIEREEQERKVLAALLKEVQEKAEFNLKADAEMNEQVKAMGIEQPRQYDPDGREIMNNSEFVDYVLDHPHLPWGILKFHRYTA